MAINALLCKIIFDENPDHEFYIEESFPLDWMFPHLSPYGIIMKINREPLKTLPEEVFEKDHEFWSQYSERLIGNWITYYNEERPHSSHGLLTPTEAYDIRSDKLKAAA